MSNIVISVMMCFSVRFLTAVADKPRVMNTFLYFAYGSNLLAERIHINSPTAVRKTTGWLENYRLDFAHWSQRWKGCSATIVPDPGKVTWGAVWEIENSNMANLDKQEGVAEQIYFPIHVTVNTTDGQELECRSYQLCNTPQALPSNETLPMDRRPSHLYLQVIIQGAQESGLPENYIKFLQEIPHNDFRGTIDMIRNEVAEKPLSDQ